MKNYVILDTYDNNFVQNKSLKYIPCDNGKFLSPQYTENFKKACRFSKIEAETMKKKIADEILKTFNEKENSLVILKVE